MTEVRQGIVEELDKRFPLPDDDLGKLQEEKRRIDTAIRNKKEEQKEKCREGKKGGGAPGQTREWQRVKFA